MRGLYFRVMERSQGLFIGRILVIIIRINYYKTFAKTQNLMDLDVSGWVRMDLDGSDLDGSGWVRMDGSGWIVTASAPKPY